MNFCHNCQHARQYHEGTRCAKGRPVVWQWPQGSLDTQYGHKSAKGCAGAFTPRRSSFYRDHGTMAQGRPAKAA